MTKIRLLAKPRKIAKKIAKKGGLTDIFKKGALGSKGGGALKRGLGPPYEL